MSGHTPFYQIRINRSLGQANGYTEVRENDTTSLTSVSLKPPHVESVCSLVVDGIESHRVPLDRAGGHPNYGHWAPMMMLKNDLEFLLDTHFLGTEEEIANTGWSHAQDSMCPDVLCIACDRRLAVSEVKAFCALCEAWRGFNPSLY